jgi:hypothetical protein
MEGLVQTSSVNGPFRRGGVLPDLSCAKCDARARGVLVDRPEAVEGHTYFDVMLLAMRGLAKTCDCVIGRWLAQAWTVRLRARENGESWVCWYCQRIFSESGELVRSLTEEEGNLACVVGINGLAAFLGLIFSERLNCASCEPTIEYSAVPLCSRCSGSGRVRIAADEERGPRPQTNDPRLTGWLTWTKQCPVCNGSGQPPEAAR